MMKTFHFLFLFLAVVDLAMCIEHDEDCVVKEDGSVICTKKEAVESSIDDDDDEYFDVDDDDYEEDEEDKDCIDTHERCSFWASAGECTANPNYMMNHCKKACNNCSNRAALLNSSEMRAKERDFLLEAISQYGDPQTVEGSQQDLTMLVIRKTIDYMKNYIYSPNPTHRLSEPVLAQCTNNHKLCAFWAAIGECENNVAFMQTKCAPSCMSCHNIDFGNRCPPRPKDAKPGLRPGELNLMFQRIVDTAPGNEDDVQQKRVQDNGTPFYKVNVHSRPKSPTAVPDENGVIPFDKMRDLNEDPWVITFDNFLTDEECDHLIELGHKNGYERSRDVGTKTADGSFTAVESTSRTSSNSWCSEKTGCRNDPIAFRVMERISNVTKVPTENFEDFQMLKYEVGQFYGTHHDYIGHQRDRAPGPRILTFFLYLSDVEEAGGTGLNQIDNLVVNPKKGKALLWPSVLNFDPSAKDGRTTHEAIAVGKGTKYAANVWIHLFDVLEPQRKGCT